MRKLWHFDSVIGGSLSKCDWFFSYLNCKGSLRQIHSFSKIQCGLSKCDWFFYTLILKISLRQIHYFSKSQHSVTTIAEVLWKNAFRIMRMLLSYLCWKILGMKFENVSYKPHYVKRVQIRSFFWSVFSSIRTLFTQWLYY